MLYGGGYRAPPTLVDLSGRRWLVATPTSPLEYNHHVERLATGEVLTIFESTNEARGDRWDGFTVGLLDPALSSFVWTWPSQRGVDDGWLAVPPEDEHDPYHANAAVLSGDHLYVSLRSPGQVVKIDRASGELLWTLGRGGDFVLLEADGAAAADARWFYGGGSNPSPRILRGGGARVTPGHASGRGVHQVEASPPRFSLAVVALSTACGRQPETWV